MSKMGNTEITDEWSFRHAGYVDTAAQNLKDFRNSSLLTCSHIMDISRSENNISAFEWFWPDSDGNYFYLAWNRSLR